MFLAYSFQNHQIYTIKILMENQIWNNVLKNSTTTTKYWKSYLEN